MRCCATSPEATPAEVRAALDAGASGYLLKTAGPQELFTAIVTIAGGSRFVPDTLRRLAAESASHPHRRQGSVLIVAKGIYNCRWTDVEVMAEPRRIIGGIEHQSARKVTALGAVASEHRHYVPLKTR